MRVGVFAGALLLQLAANDPKRTDFRYLREIVLPAVAPGTPACVVLDGTLYADAAPALADLRVLGAEGGAALEIPYALTISETGSASDPATVLHLAVRGQTVTFDLQMPDRPYSGLVLQLGGRDFQASARVTGLRNPNDPGGTVLGTATLFDLSGKRLGRNTSLPLPESSFPYLHVELAFAPAPGQAHFVAAPALVEGAQVPPSREAQELYTPVAETRRLFQRGHESVAGFVLPAHVPVERVSFVLAPGYVDNFSRPVRVLARADHARGGQEPAQEEVDGEIARVRIGSAGRLLRASTLSVPVLLASNLQSAARVEVAVENGDDPPLKIQSVRLEMQQRKLCFAVPGMPLALYSGASGLKPPVYDLPQIFRPGQTAAVARLGPETANPAYVAAPRPSPLFEHLPRVAWGKSIGLFLVLSGLIWSVAGRRKRRA